MSLFSPYFQISEQNILSRGIEKNGHEYIVYYNNKRYKCCIYYSRKLCDTISDLEKITKEEIERQAYGSWMDGAR